MFPTLLFPTLLFPTLSFPALVSFLPHLATAHTYSTKIRQDWHGLLTNKRDCVWGGRSAKHGFMWWELDWVYLGLRALASLGIVWDMKVVTDEVVKARYLLGNKRPALSRIYRITCPYPSNHHLAPISLLISISLSSSAPLLLPVFLHVLCACAE